MGRASEDTAALPKHRAKERCGCYKRKLPKAKKEILVHPVTISINISVHKWPLVPC